MNYLLDKLMVDLADLALERVTALGFQQRAVDYTGDWTTTRTITLDYFEAPSRHAFYDACWSFVCASVSATESKSCRLLIYTRPATPFVREEPKAVKGELVTSDEPAEGSALSYAQRFAARRVSLTQKIEQGLSAVIQRSLGEREDPRRQHENPNVIVIFPLPLANIRRSTRKRVSTPVDLTAQLLAASELADFTSSGEEDV